MNIYLVTETLQADAIRNEFVILSASEILFLINSLYICQLVI